MDPRATVRLGRTDLHVTRLGLGSAPLGMLFQPVEEEAALAVVERALELGVRLFDTAPLYGSGLAERRFGRVLAGRPRESLVLATKVGRLIRGGEPVFDFSYEGVQRSLAESLERLRLDRVEILHIHDPDDQFNEALSGAYRALAELREEGVIAAVGAGMNQAPMLARFAREGDFDCFLLAGRYTLLDQSGLEELLPLCQSKDIAVIIGGVYNSGLLADPKPGAPYDYRPAPAALVKKARSLAAVCERHGVPLKAAAIQFPFGHPAVTTVLAGSRSVPELDENARLLEWPIPAALWAELKAEHLLDVAVPTP